MPASMAGIRFVDIKLDLENIDQGIKHILDELRPEWNYEDVVSKEFTEGYSNKILCYHQAGDEKMDYCQAPFVRCGQFGRK